MLDTPDTIVLSVPATPAALRVMRAVASSVATRLQMPFDLVEELRIVVGEAGTMLIELGGSEIHLEIKAGGPTLEAIVWTDVDGAGWPSADQGRSWGWQVIQGLSDEAEQVVHGGNPAVRFVRRSPT